MLYTYFLFQIHSQNSSKRTEPIDVRAKLAKTAGVSTDTYSKGKKILDSDNDTLKQEVLSGEKSINAGYKELTQSKEVLKDLIETNIRQRGIGNPNPIKLGKCIKELERIYGFREGRPEKLSNNFTVNRDQPKNESELAEQLGITRQSLQNYKKLAEMIPEIS